MIGQTLGHYHILEKIGQGGMGVVYRAHDERLDRDVAIKVLPADSLTTEAARKRFRKEALALAKLNHPNIATIYEFDTQNGLDFLVMEFVAGTTLADRIRQGALPEKEVAHLSIQIAEALREAHETGIIHRDLKPRNILITPKGQAKLLDFGLAKLLRPESEISTIDVVGSTAARVGTLAYMSPEQLRAESADIRSDIYAMGVILYEMATCKRPFSGTVALVDDILYKAPPRPSASRHGISSRLEEIILKCLEKEPENRYQSAKELIVDLRRLDSPTALPSATTRLQKLKYRQYGLLFVSVVMTLVVIVVGLNVSGWRRPMSAASPPSIQSLAVLPLENLSHDPEQDYFADGMTEALITNLSRISTLRVISRTSVMRYKGERKPLPQIGKELNVDGVIEGSVQRSGDRVRVNAQLIYAATDTHLWVETYDRDRRDLLALQDEVARAVASEIRVKVTPQDQERLVQIRQVKPEAQEFYLKGRYYWHKRTPDGLKKSLEYFQQALAVDPNYASAYAGLADSYILLANQGVFEPVVAVLNAKAAARKALALDNKLGEAYASLGLANLYDGLNWRDAENDFKLAIELNPSYATAFQWYALTLAVIGQPEELLQKSRRAVELDPLSPMINSYLGRAYYLSRKYDEAIQQCLKTLDMEPEFPVAHLFLGMAYTQKGRHREAIAEIRKAVDLSKNDPPMVAAMAYAYAAAGESEEALKVLRTLLRPTKEKFVFPADIAVIYAGLGRKDQVFTWLEKAYDEGSLWAISLKLDPELDGIRSDHRFAELLQRTGLPLGSALAN